MGAETCIRVAKSGAKPPRESCCALHNGGVLYVGLFHSHPAKVGNQHFRLRMLLLHSSGSKDLHPTPHLHPPTTTATTPLPPIPPRPLHPSHYTPPVSIPVLDCAVPSIPRFQLTGHFIRYILQVAVTM